MLSLRRKPGERVFIGDTPLLVESVTNHDIIVVYKGKKHFVHKGAMYYVEPDLILCYNRRIASSAKFQILTTEPILREELYTKGEPK